MNIIRAREIVSRLVRTHMIAIGVVEESRPDLSDYSLHEMIMANRVVWKADQRKQRVQLICDDRLIAAIYALVHYQTDSEPIAQIGGKCIAVMPTKGSIVFDDEEWT